MLKKLLLPPIFDDDEKKRHENWINISIRVGGIYLFLTLLADILTEQVTRQILIRDGSIFLMLITLQRLLWQGRVRWAAFGTIAILFLWVTDAGIGQGTIRTPAVAGYILVIILSGLIFNWSGLFFSITGSSMAIAGLIIAENAGLLPVPDYRDGYIQWLALTFIFGASGSLTLYINQSTKDALTRLKQESEERSRAEAALRKSGADYKATLDNLLIGVVVHDADTRVILSNPTAQNILGLTEDQILGKQAIDAAWKFVDEMGRQIEVEEYPVNIVFRQKRPLNNYQFGIEKPGFASPTWVNVNGMPVFRDDGNIEKVIINFVDITEIKLAETKMRESEDRYRKISNLISDYVFSFGPDENGVLRREWTSGAFEQITGHKPDDPIMSRGLEAIVHPEDAHIWKLRNTRLNSGQVDKSEFRIIRPDGSIRWLSAYGYGVLDEKTGRPIHSYGAIQDITEQKLVEDKLRQRNQHLSNLQQITLDLLNRKDTQTLLNNITHHAASLVNAEHGYIFLPDGDNLVLQAATVEFSHNIGRSEPKPGKGVLGKVWQSGEIVIVENYEAWEFRDERYKGENLRSLAGIPIKTNEEIIGVLEVANTSSSFGFSEEDLQSLNHLASLAVLVLNNSKLLDSNEHEIHERKQMENALLQAYEELQTRADEVFKLQADLRLQALHDSLTGLYNRRYLDQTLDRELARTDRLETPLSIIIMDIDHFKEINDSYGHYTGDVVLKEIANTVKNFARSTDICCRFGGEEFLLVMPESDAASAAKRAEELRKVCAALQVKHEGYLLNVTLSFGVAGYPEHCKTSAELLIKADKALYQSKQQGRNRVTIWGED